MLSKLTYFSGTTCVSLTDAEERNKRDLFFLAEKLPSFLVKTFETNATLGNLYLAESKDDCNKKLVIKTSDDKKRFRNEISLFKQISPEAYETSFNDCENNDKPFMVMKYLSKVGSVTINIDDILRLLDEVQQKCVKLTPPYHMEDMNDYIVFIEKGLYFLRDCKHINKDLFDELSYDFNFFRDKFTSVRRVLCHGDLSNKNIMTSGGGNLVLTDFEDAFWGIEGYDLIYWLTFFDQKRFYRKGFLSDVSSILYPSMKRGEANLITKCIFEFVVLLKSYLSVLNKSIQDNKMSIQERILETRFIL